MRLNPILYRKTVSCPSAELFPLVFFRIAGYWLMAWRSLTLQFLRRIMSPLLLLWCYSDFLHICLISWPVLQVDVGSMNKNPCKSLGQNGRLLKDIRLPSRVYYCFVLFFLNDFSFKRNFCCLQKTRSLGPACSQML